MKKLLFFGLFCAMSFAFVSCNTNSEKSESKEKFEILDINYQAEFETLLSKAKAEGTDWSVEQWKDFIVDVSTIVLSHSSEKAEVRKWLQSNSDSEAEARLKVLLSYDAPIEDMIEEGGKILQSTKNGKIADADSVWLNGEHMRRVKKATLERLHCYLKK